MNSKQSKECPNCHRWISCTKGGFMKHAQKCLPKPDESVSSTNEYIWSVNPLLSLTDDKHSANIDYTNCDLYDNLSSVDGSNISNGDDSNIINGDDSSLTHHNINCDADSFSIIEDDEFKFIWNAILQRTTAVIKFQVMLHEIIMKLKASLCMYDDILSSCHWIYLVSKLQQICKAEISKIFPQINARNPFNTWIASKKNQCEAAHRDNGDCSSIWY